MNFFRIKLRKVSVKVPKLRIKKKAAEVKKGEIPISSIVNVLLKNAIEISKSEKKEKPAVEKNETYISKKDEKPAVNGGYGTVSKNYGLSPRSSYADYAKLFSYLGKFKANGDYGAENRNSEAEAMSDNGFSLVDRATMDKGAVYIRYFNSKAPIDKSSLVPIAGMNSAEWESFKMWMRLDTAMYLLKISTS